MTLLLSLACGYQCGEGTLPKDGECVVDTAALAGDTGPTVDSDTGDGGDSDTGEVDDSDTGETGGDSGAETGDSDSGDTEESGGDTGEDTGEPDTGTYTGPCAPPDRWTGGVPDGLYTTTPYDPSYDAGMAALADMLPGNGGGTYGDATLILGATIVAVDTAERRVYAADAGATLPMNTSVSTHVGDMVAFAFNSYTGEYGLRVVEDPSGWTLLSSGNPVSVLEVGSTSLDYFAKYSQFMHLYGEITRPSSWDCGTGHACYIVDHEGTTNLIRLPNNNPFGLDPDYVGGLCAELVAPVGIYTGDDGDAIFLDVANSAWMRTWKSG